MVDCIKSSHIIVSVDAITNVLANQSTYHQIITNKKIKFYRHGPSQHPNPWSITIPKSMAI